MYRNECQVLNSGINGQSIAMPLSNLEEKEGTFSDSSGFHYDKHTHRKLGVFLAEREQSNIHLLGEFH